MTSNRHATEDRRATVVICAYTMERLDETLLSVRSALAQEPAPDRVVLVVDHNEELLGRLREELVAADDATAPRVEVVASTGPRGLSGARNTGIAHATGDVTAFLDDDATADPGWLAGLLAAFEDPHVLGAGGGAIAAWNGGAQPTWFPDAYLWVVGCSYEGMTTSGPVRNVLGCNMAFRTELLGELGGFDPAVGRLGTLPLGCEETELCIRARRLHPDGIVVAVPGATVTHHVAAARRTPTYFLRRCFYEGISKAVLLRLSDGEAVASERAYTLRTLPRAAARGIRDTVLLRDPRAALGRVGAIVVGLMAATAGFGVGLVLDRMRGSREAIPAEASR